LGQIQGNSLNICDFLKFVISVKGGHRYSSRHKT